jgi:antitoxin component YwqK of YwqJK toxin-antitoxin module
MRKTAIILSALSFLAVSCKVANKNAADNSHIRTEFHTYGDIQACDSIFYDALGNDTLKKSFIHNNGIWQLKQTFRQRFNAQGQVVYFITERLSAENPYKKEIFYIYNQQGKLTEETEYECSAIILCDSLVKTKYRYDVNGELLSKTLYKWQNSEWLELERKK